MNGKPLFAALMTIPLLWIGILIGARLHFGLTEVQMRRIIGALFLVIGAILRARYLMQPT